MTCLRWVVLGAACLEIACGPTVLLDDGGADGGTSEVGTSAAETSPMTTMSSPPNVTTAGADDDTGGDPPSMTSVGPDPTGDVGQPCSDHARCPSGYCREFSDAPADPEAACDGAPPNGNTRFTGTVRDVATRQPLAGVDVVIARLLESLVNPTGALALASTTTDGAGRLDATPMLPISDQLGAVVLASSDDHYLTNTAVAAPVPGGEYPPGNIIHDVWAASVNDLENWSTLLAGVGVAPELLPLGEAGGCLVVVRDAVTGEPIAEASVVSVLDDSSAGVHYPSADGVGLTAQTSELGIAIVVDPTLAEEFIVLGDDQSFVASSGPGAINVVGVLTD